MPAIKDILKHVVVEIAMRKRRCHRTASHTIRMGQVCLVVEDERGSKRNYCPECAQPIIDAAYRRLGEYVVDLGARTVRRSGEA